MTAQSKTTIKTYFQTGDRPTEAQFINLIDSYQDANSNLLVLASAGAPGAVGLQVLTAATTAAALNSLTAAPTASPTFSGTVTADTIQTSGSSGVALKNSSGQTALTAGTTGTQNVSIAGALSVTGAIIGASINFGGSTLSTYSTGTYNPTIACGTSGTITLNSSNDTASYERIGDMVRASGYLQVSSVSSPTGTINISLPFTAATIAEGGDFFVGTCIISGTVSSSAGLVPGYIDPSAPTLLKIYLNGTTSLGGAAAQQIQANSDIYFNICYRAV